MVKSSIFLRMILNFDFFPPAGEREGNPWPRRPGIGAAARPSSGLFWPGRRGLCGSVQEGPGLGHFLYDLHPRRGRCRSGKGPALSGRARQGSGPPFSQSSLARAAGGYARQPKRNRAWAIFSTAFTPKGDCSGERGEAALSGRARQGRPPFSRFSLARAAGGYARQPKRDRAWAIFSMTFTPKGQRLSQPPQAMQSAAVAGRAW